MTAPVNISPKLVIIFFILILSLCIWKLMLYYIKIMMKVSSIVVYLVEYYRTM